jgi:hypothetical protein
VGWGGVGQKVIPRPSADYFVVGRRQKTKRPAYLIDEFRPKVLSEINNKASSPLAALRRPRGLRQ